MIAFNYSLGLFYVARCTKNALKHILPLVLYLTDINKSDKVEIVQIYQKISIRWL